MDLLLVVVVVVVIVVVVVVVGFFFTKLLKKRGKGMKLTILSLSRNQIIFVKENIISYN